MTLFMISEFKLCWNLVESDAKKRVFLTFVIMVFLNLLDITAVGLAGVVGALAIRGVQGLEAGDRSSQFLSFFGLDDSSLQVQIVSLALLALLLMIFKSFLAYVATKRIFLFMSNQAALLSQRLVRTIYQSPINLINQRSSQEYIFHINSGTGHLMMGVIGTSFAILADLTLFVSLTILLIIVDAGTALISAALFILIGYLLYISTQKRAIKLGSNLKELTVGVNDKVMELFSSLREIITRNTEKKYNSEIYRTRMRLVATAADLKMMPLFSKYIIEASIYFTFLFIAFLQFLLNDTARAVGNLALFLAASSRIAPAVHRIQNGFIQVKSAIGASEITLKMLRQDSESALQSSEIVVAPGTFMPTVEFRDVSFNYIKSSDWEISHLSFKIEARSFVAFTGPSGAGKSTVIDLLFGLLTPGEGEVLVSGLNARTALSVWPGFFGYVPQDVSLNKGSILENLLLGMEDNQSNRNRAEECLEFVGLTNFVQGLSKGINTALDDKGTSLSGGQKQRIGIARALMSSPELLVLDESTSSLDAMSEDSITKSLQRLKGNMTIVVIAHRLSTVRYADKIFYMEDGRILDSGDFISLRLKLGKFDEQARLMGL